MTKNIGRLLLVSCVVISSAGCYTLKGTAQGAAKDAQVAAGAAVATWKGLVRADVWMQENMW